MNQVSTQKAEIKEGYAMVQNAGVGSERYKSRILPIRDLNNWVKAALIDVSLKQIKHGFVLDFCCGKGGDLLKYAKPSVTYYVGVDLVMESILEAIKRYNEKLTKERQRARNNGRLIYTADFLCADVFGTDFPRYLKRPNTRFDVVSCMFALHYAFENADRASCFFKNIQQLLAPNGSFIAVFPCKESILSRFQANGYKDQNLPEGAVIQNDFYRVTIPKELKRVADNLYGQEYKFYLDEAVGDITEYFIDMRNLKYLCNQHGLTIAYDFSSLEEFTLSSMVQSPKTFFPRMMAKTAKYLTNYNNKLSTGHEVDDNFWEELDQEQEKEDTNIQIQEIKEMSQIPEMYREVSNLYRAVIIKHANPSGVPSGSKFEPRPADYRCLRDVVNLTGEEFDIPRLREHFAEDLQWKPFVGDNKEYFI